MRPVKIVLLSLLSAWSACATSTLPFVVDARDIAPASSPPTIVKIGDMGTALIPRAGLIDGLSDGSAGAGELLVVEGDRFGRLPTVLIGSRPAAVLARTKGGGIVVRVPRGVQVGKVDVVVSTGAGTARMSTELRRLALLLEADKLHFASVGEPPDPKIVGELALPGGRMVRVESSGGVALVLADEGAVSRVAVVDLGRAVPSLLGALTLTHRAAALAVATDAPRAIAIGDGKLSVIDMTSVRRPVLFDAAALPKEVAGVRAAEVSPDGKTLAVLLAHGNRVVAVDITNPTAPTVISAVEILPNEKQALAHDLAFSPDGQTLWVVSGSSAETHPQVIPTRITVVKLVATTVDGLPSDGDAPTRVPIGPGKRLLAVWKTQTVTGAGAPISLVVGNAPDAQGSAIRSAPEVATVYLTAAKNALLDLKSGPIDAARVRKIMGAPNAGMIARAELGTGGGPIATTRELLGSMALLPGGTHAIAAAVRAAAAGDGLELGIATVTLDGQASLRFAPIGPLPAARVAPPFALGDLALQP